MQVVPDARGDRHGWLVSGEHLTVLKGGVVWRAGGTVAGVRFDEGRICRNLGCGIAYGDWRDGADVRFRMKSL